MARVLAAAGVLLAVAAVAVGWAAAAAPHHALAGLYEPPRWVGAIEQRESRAFRETGHGGSDIKFGRHAVVIELQGYFTCGKRCPYDDQPPRGNLLRIEADPKTHKVTHVSLEPSQAEAGAIARARASSPNFRIFPREPSTIRCYFGRSAWPRRGWCNTTVSAGSGYSGQTRVVFRESWYVRSRLHLGRWVVTLAPSGRVVGTRRTGEAPVRHQK